MESGEIENICKMGFAKEIVEKAFKANKNNTEKTIEMLKFLKKIPPSDEEVDDDDEEYESSDSEIDPLENLSRNKKFRSMCKYMLKEDAEHLNILLEKIVQLNPSLMDDITLNQAAFLKLVTAIPEDLSIIDCDLDLSEKDEKSIATIKALGYDEHDILQVYFASNKDETKTIENLKTLNTN